jgi:hypothetical protein
MKKITLTITGLFFLQLFGFSQSNSEKDSTKHESEFFIGGTISLDNQTNTFKYYYSKDDLESKSRYVKYAPYLGYFISKKSALGLRFEYANYDKYSHDTRHIYINENNTLSSRMLDGKFYSIAPFFRFKNKLIKEKISYFIDLQLGYEFSEEAYIEAKSSSRLDYGTYEYDQKKYFIDTHIGFQ